MGQIPLLNARPHSLHPLKLILGEWPLKNNCKQGYIKMIISNFSLLKVLKYKIRSLGTGPLLSIYLSECLSWHLASPKVNSWEMAHHFQFSWPVSLSLSRPVGTKLTKKSGEYNPNPIEHCWKPCPHSLHPTKWLTTEWPTIFNFINITFRFLNEEQVLTNLASKIISN